MLAESGPLEFDPLGFDHPLCVLFSSGTTGLPKAIVHRHGGILIEAFKNQGLSWDQQPGDRLLWFTTTAWMMWMALVELAVVPGFDRDARRQSDVPGPLGSVAPRRGASADADGSRARLPDGLPQGRRRPARHGSLQHPPVLRSRLASSPEGFDWIYEQLGSDVLLNVGSGGTDVCTGMVQGGPMQPVYRGEIAGCCLAVDVAAYDENAQPVVGELGELVIRKPMPSMPIAFWGDEDGSRYRAAYFEHFPGVWRHGDWIMFTERGSCVITGRSDATLNRGGVRLGTGEVYSVVEGIDEVQESLVVHIEDPEGGAGELILFVALSEGIDLDDELRGRIASELRGALSPRHVPDTIEAVPVIPKTLTMKKLELPVKRILLGDSPEKVASRDALADPQALDAFVAYASQRGSERRRYITR